MEIINIDTHANYIHNDERRQYYGTVRSDRGRQEMLNKRASVFLKSVSTAPKPYFDPFPDKMWGK